MKAFRYVTAVIRGLQPVVAFGTWLTDRDPKIVKDFIDTAQHECGSCSFQPKGG